MRKKRMHLRQIDDDVVVSFSFQQAFDYFYSGKRSEEMRETTLISYKEHYKFYVNGLENTEHEITLVVSNRSQLS